MKTVLVPTARFCAKAPSNIVAVGYDCDNRTLAVEFKSSTGRKIYPYLSVPLEVAQQFVTAPSLGVFHASQIKALPGVYATIPNGYDEKSIAERVADLADSEPLPEWLSVVTDLRVQVPA